MLVSVISGFVAGIAGGMGIGGGALLIPGAHASGRNRTAHRAERKPFCFHSDGALGARYSYKK